MNMPRLIWCLVILLCGHSDIASAEVDDASVDMMSRVQAGTGRDRDAPVAFGDTAPVGDFTIRVVEATPDATAQIVAEIPYSNPPDAGHQFYLARLEATYTGRNSVDMASALNFQAVGARNRGYDVRNADCGPIPEPAHQVGELFEGAVAEFNVCWEIDARDADSLVMYVDPLSVVEGEERVWFSLTPEGGHAPVSPTVPPVTPAETEAATPPMGVTTLEARDPFTWSETELSVTPGETIVVTNVGVLQHTFAVDEWDIDLNLPNGVPVEVVVPQDAQPGQYKFYCSVPGHAEGGMVGTVTVVEAGQDGSASPPASPQATAVSDGQGGHADDGQPIQLEAQDPFAWSPNQLTVTPGQTITVTNVGALQHTFAVDAWGIDEELPNGQPVEIQVPPDAEPGQYEFYCSVPGHREGGMVGKITVA